MAVTDYKFPGTAANVDYSSGTAWTNPNYAKTDDTGFAAVALAKYTSSDWLLLTNYGFSSSDIPDGSTINGIEFVINRKASAAGVMTDLAIYLYDNGNVGSSLAVYSLYGSSEGTATYGGATNMCGTSLTQADIVASTFGVAFSTRNGDSSTTRTVYVDYIKIRVYYTEGGSSPVFLPNIMKHNFIPPLIGGY